ncbi:MAG TPA: deaminase, partial [Lichenihabitans sp.]|nr:deaminase [Lichenihabitans sp.]
DLSRQVGAAIFSKLGEVISLGCNEVPKAPGGTYWIDEEPHIFRDVEIGRDSNQEQRNVLLHDFLDRMTRHGFISQNLLNKGDTQAQIESILSIDDLKECKIMDIIEFARVIHAEMSAISDAARNGRSTQNATLFCTTFPCHMCAKHIVAAGVTRVVFLEPYPKSYSKQLHGDSITFDVESTGKVLFEPFIGISPRRYRDIFEKKKRKDKKGQALTWYNDDLATPMIEDKGASYIQYEPGHAFKAIAFLQSPDCIRGEADQL